MLQATSHTSKHLDLSGWPEPYEPCYLGTLNSALRCVYRRYKYTLAAYCKVFVLQIPPSFESCGRFHQTERCSQGPVNRLC